MEGTAKLTTRNVAAKVRADLADRLSKEMVTRTDDFTKLLQQKKDLAQTKEQPKADSAKDDRVKDKKAASSDSKSEKPQNGKEDVQEDDLQQEALRQSAQQQAMAQLNLVQAQIQPETTPEVIAEAVTETPVQAVEAAQVMGEQPQILAEAAQIPQSQNGETVPLSGKQEKLQTENLSAEAKAGAAKEEQPLTPLTDVVAQSRGTKEQSGAPEKGLESSIQSSGEQKAQAAEQEDGREAQPLYGEDTFRTSMETRESAFAGERTEPIPVKTTPETMPQDLGRTLAGRIGGGPKTIVIELEPASLGKLTIRLTYEASRAALSIAASNPKTLELLNQRAGEIAQILEEKTGQETVIFTQPTEQEPQYQDGRSSSQGNGGQEDRGEKHPDQRKEEQQAGSFAQQLRLGLI